MKRLNSFLRINLLIVCLSTVLFSCTDKGQQKFASSAAQEEVVSPSCGAIDMSPQNGLYPYTTVNFGLVPPTGTTLLNVQWSFAKDTNVVLTSATDTVSHIFNGPNEGTGSYTATATFQKSDGNSCALEKSFQILKIEDDICPKPSGISGPTIGYVGEETSPFSVDAEECFQGSLAWDMNSDGVTEYTTTPSEFLVHTYNQAGTYTITTTVTELLDDQPTTLTHTIEIRNKSCLNPFTNTAVLHGESVEFARTSDQCGSKPCDKTQRVCSNGVFAGDTTFTENPATCAVTPECPASYAWQASEFGQCTGACESANGTRPITNYICKKTLSGTTTTASDAECVTSIGAKPTGQTQSCNVAPQDQNLNCLSCGTTPHNGSITQWATSPACGHSCASQTRVCKNGTIPPFGTGFTYTSQASCPITACPPVYTYDWKVGAYGACSATACGTQGVQTRSVICTRNDGVSVTDSFCKNAKPDTTKACSAAPCETTDSCKVINVDQSCRAAINNPAYTHHRVAPLNWSFYNSMGDAFGKGKTKPFSPFNDWWGWSTYAYKINYATGDVTAMTNGMKVEKNEVMYCMGTYEDKDRRFVRFSHALNGFVLSDVPDTDYMPPKAPQTTCRYPAPHTVRMITTMQMKCSTNGPVGDQALSQNRVLWDNANIFGMCGF